MGLFSKPSKIKRQDFYGGYFKSKVGKKIRKTLGSRFSIAKKKALFKTMKKKGRQGGGLTKTETEDIIKTFYRDKNDRFSKSTAAGLKKPLEEITGYKNLRWGDNTYEKQEIDKELSNEKFNEKKDSNNEQEGKEKGLFSFLTKDEKKASLREKLFNRKKEKGKENQKEETKEEEEKKKISTGQFIKKILKRESRKNRQRLEKMNQSLKTKDLNRQSRQSPHPVNLNLKNNKIKMANPTNDPLKNNGRQNQNNDLNGLKDQGFPAPNRVQPNKIPNSTSDSQINKQNPNPDLSVSANSAQTQNKDELPPGADLSQVKKIPTTPQQSQNPPESNQDNDLKNSNEEVDQNNQDSKTKIDQEKTETKQDPPSESVSVDDKKPDQPNNKYHLRERPDPPNTAKRKPKQEKIEEKLFLSVISILITDRDQSAPKINLILTQNGRLFIGRMGIPLARKCVKNCSSIITLIAQTTLDELKDLERELNQVQNVIVKTQRMPSLE